MSAPTSCPKCSAAVTQSGQPSKRWFFACGSFLIEGAEMKLRDRSDLCEARERLVEAENILERLATGYWVHMLNAADDPVAEKMGDRVLNYWRRFNE